MPLQYSQDDDGLHHALGVQEQLEEICASPEATADHLLRIAALMSESGGDFDAAIMRRGAELIQNSPFVNAAYDSEVSALKEAIRSLLPIIEAVRYTAGLGKNQMARVEAVKALVARD